MAQSAVARAAEAVLLEDTAAVATTRNAVTLRSCVAATITVLSIVWCLDLPRAVGIVVYTEQYLALMLGLCFALVFLQSPARIGSRRTRLPWYDAALALMGLGAAWYTSFNYAAMVDSMIEKPTSTLIVGLILFSVAMEAMRRTSGWTMFCVVGGVVAYALFGHHGPGLLQTREIPFDKLFIYLALDSSALIGPTLEIGVTVVLAFIFFGNLLIRSHGSNFFNEFAIALLGRYRGGSAKCAIVASGLFGTITGTAASNIMAVGTITIPMMRKAGYPAHVAAAIEAVASTGGALMPPVMGAVAFLMADILQIPYREIAIAAAVPAVLYYLALFIVADLEAAKGGYARVAQELIPKLRHVFETGWVFLLPFAALIWAMFGANVAAERAALYAAVAVLIVGFALGYKDKHLSLRDVWDSLVETSAGAVSVILIVAASGFIMGVLNLSGLGFALTMALVELGSDNVIYLLVMCAVINVFLGLGMPAIGVYVLLAVVVAPSLVQVGISPLAAHMFIFYFGLMSAITPPVAVSAFFAAQIAGSPLQKTGWTAMRFGWTAYIVPFLFVFSPSFFLMGPIGTVLFDVATAIGAVWVITAAFVGYLFRPLATNRRILLAVAGALLMVPLGLAPWTIWCNLAAGALAILLIAWEGLAARRLFR